MTVYNLINTIVLVKILSHHVVIMNQDNSISVLGLRKFEIALIHHDSMSIEIKHSNLGKYLFNSTKLKMQHIKTLEIKIHEFQIIEEGIELLSREGVDLLKPDDQIRIPNKLSYYCLGGFDIQYYEDFDRNITLSIREPCLSKINKNRIFCQRHTKNPIATYIILARLRSQAIQNTLKKWAESGISAPTDIFSEHIVYILLLNNRLKVGTCRAKEYRFVQRIAEQLHDWSIILDETLDLISAKKLEETINRKSGGQIVQRFRNLQEKINIYFQRNNIDKKDQLNMLFVLLSKTDIPEVINTLITRDTFYAYRIQPMLEHKILKMTGIVSVNDLRGQVLTFLGMIGEATIFESKTGDLYTVPYGELMQLGVELYD